MPEHCHWTKTDSVILGVVAVGMAAYVACTWPLIVMDRVLYWTQDYWKFW